MTVQPTSREVRERAQQVLGDLLRLMGFEGRIDGFEQGQEEVLLHIESPDASRLIGRDAQMLNALQTIVNRIVFRGVEQSIRCTVDVERYRERRKDRLVQMANEAADEVRRTGRPVKLTPMNSHDRRVIHQALKDDSAVQTYSEKLEEEGRKLVVVAPAGDQPPPADDSGPAGVEEPHRV